MLKPYAVEYTVDEKAPDSDRHFETAIDHCADQIGHGPDKFQIINLPVRKCDLVYAHLDLC